LLAIRVTGALADVHYFPNEDHPGFRCLGGDGLPDGGTTTLVFPGCDPATGEETPNEFVVSFETARRIAREFFYSRQMSPGFSWFELYESPSREGRRGRAPRNGLAGG
jgi:hypothetical protein